MTMSIEAIGTAIVNAFKATFALLPALGGAILDTVEALVFTGTGESQTLSSFVVIALVFGGVALVIGISKWVTNWIGRKTGK